MFTGFASENTPVIQVWDFFRTFASTAAPRRVCLTDDCAPIQIFKTGATTTSINVYLPTCPIEGKQITITNLLFGSSVQKLSILSSDVSGDGTNTILFDLGVSSSLVLVYTKQAISYGTSIGVYQSGWIPLNQAPATAPNYYSVVIGGYTNNASNAYAFVGGGNTNTASGFNGAIIGGSGNLASGNSAAIAGGANNVASGGASFAAGQNNTASGVAAAVMAGENSLSNGRSSVVFGTYGTARGITGNTVSTANYAPIANTLGLSQSALLVLGVETTNATATVLKTTTSAASTTNQVILPNNSGYVFQGTCIANVTGGSTTSGWKYEGVIKRGANAASTALVAAVTPSVIAQDAAAATWVLAITADTTNGGIAVTVTGAAATTIRWVSRIQTTEVTF